MDAPVPDSLEAAVCQHFGVDAAEAPALVAEFDRVVCRGGDWLFRQDDVGDSLYLLVRGRLQVWIGHGDAARLVADVEPGEMIGEIALLAGGTRSAGVRAVRDSLLLRLDTTAFDRIAARHPAWLRRMAGRIAVRLRDRTSGGGPQRRFLKTIAFVPLDDTAPVRELAARLADALRLHGTVATLTPERLSELGGAADASPDRMDAARVDRLAALEDAHRFLLYVTPPDAGAASKLAVRHADLVLLVGRAGTDAASRAWEPALFDDAGGPVVRRALVLLHDGAPTHLQGTDAWLGARRLDFHLHLRDGVAADLDRLARVLSGEALGLVLGGGAARGFAHLGVYRALHEARLPVDWVGGASIGSVMGAAVAFGLPPDEAIALARRAFVDGKPFGDVTLPVISLLRGRRMERLLAEHLPGRIEDLPLPYFCVSSNLGSGTLQVHDRGPLAPAVRASVSLPGVFPPAVIDGQLTIDGGILDNLPVELMRRRPVARVVAVDVTSRQTFTVDYSRVPSPWAVLGGRFLPFVRRRRVPSFMSLMLKATEIGTMSEVRAAGERADLLIRPAVSRFGITDVRSFDRIVQAGYEEACRAIHGWKAGAPAG